eukprot:9422935-Pyramimonas_sp.AAC.1
MACARPPAAGPASAAGGGEGAAGASPEGAGDTAGCSSKGAEGDAGEPAGTEDTAASSAKGAGGEAGTGADAAVANCADGKEDSMPPRWGPSRWGRRITPHRRYIGDASAMLLRRRRCIGD